MEVSKLELSDELKHQTSLKMAILMWLKEHPKAGQNTSTIGLAKTMGLARDFAVKSTTGSIDQAIRKLRQQGLIVVHMINLRRGDFAVNYGHPEMPPVIDDGVITSTALISDAEPKKTEQGLAPTTIYLLNGRSIREAVLEWVAQNPDRAHDTTASRIAEMMLEDGVIQCKRDSIIATIGVLCRTHKLQKKSSAKPWVYDFCLLSEDKPDTKDAPEEQVDTAEQTLVDVDREIHREIAESGTPGTEESTIETVCPEPIEVKADNGEIKLSITLNINITR